MQANRDAHGSGNASAGAGVRLGEEGQQRRRLDFVNRFQPGRVGPQLQWALGSTTIEFPWFERMQVHGYPKGYVILEGDKRECC